MDRTWPEDLKTWHSSGHHRLPISPEGPRQTRAFAIDQEILPDPDGHPVIAGETDRARRARPLALHAEETAAEVELRSPLPGAEDDRVRRAVLGAGAAPVGTLGGVQNG